MPFRDQWRDVQALHNDGIPIDTTSNETAKLFDMTLTQYTGWYNDKQNGGIDGTLSQLIQSDPSCALSQILFTGMDLMGTASPSSKLHEKTIESFRHLNVSNPYINYHREALLHWSKGHLSRACQTWEQCLLDYPFDMLAIKFVSDGYFYCGYSEMLRDCLARVIPIWENSSDRPLKSYLYGMYAFGLGENNMIERAQKEAQHGLELNCHDAWSTHAIAHALEYAGQTKEGISFLEKTEHDWTTCDFIKPHIEWHWALYEIEQGNPEHGEQILIEKILKKETNLVMLDFIDASALIYRLKLAQNSSKNGHLSIRLKHFLNEHLNDHVLIFNDLHMYFLLNDDNYDEYRQDFLRTLKETYEESDSDNAKVYHRVGRVLFQSIDEFQNKNYSKVVDLLYPIRHEIYQIGGSNAQRDLFSLMLIHSAVYSDQRKDHLLAKQLMNERCWFKNKTQSKMIENYANTILNHSF